MAIMVDIPPPEKFDTRAGYLMSWLSDQGLYPDIHHYREGRRRVKTVVRLVDHAGKEHHRIVKHFGLGELRGKRWIGTILNAAHSLVLNGDGQIR